MRGGRELFGMELMIHNVNVIGANVDDETRCAHYRDECDIIAIKFKCCENGFRVMHATPNLPDTRRQSGRKRSFTCPPSCAAAAGVN